VLVERRSKYNTRADSLTAYTSETTLACLQSHNQGPATALVLKSPKQSSLTCSLTKDASRMNWKNRLNTNHPPFTHQDNIFTSSCPSLSKRVSVAQPVIRLCDKTSREFSAEGHRFDPRHKQKYLQLWICKGRILCRLEGVFPSSPSAAWFFAFFSWMFTMCEYFCLISLSIKRYHIDTSTHVLERVFVFLKLHEMMCTMLETSSRMSFTDKDSLVVRLVDFTALVIHLPAFLHNLSGYGDRSQDDPDRSLSSGFRPCSWKSRRLLRDGRQNADPQT